jgi:hypothetical protein
MTAYYIEWHMRQKLKPILFDDHDKAAADLATVTRNVMAMDGAPEASVVLYPQLTPVQNLAQLLEPGHPLVRPINGSRFGRGNFRLGLWCER